MEEVMPGQRLGMSPDAASARVSAGAARLLAAVLGSAKPLVDLLARGAHREPVGVATGHPDLAAQRGDRLTREGALEDLLLAHVVREPVVVTGFGDLGNGLGALEHGRAGLALGLGGVRVLQRRRRLAHPPSLGGSAARTRVAQFSDGSLGNHATQRSGSGWR